MTDDYIPDINGYYWAKKNNGNWEIVELNITKDAKEKFYEISIIGWSAWDTDPNKYIWGPKIDLPKDM